MAAGVLLILLAGTTSALSASPQGGLMPPGATLSPQWINSEPDYFSPNVFWPVRNGWQVASRRQFTAVYAGGDGLEGDDATLGRIALFHQNYLRGTQDGDLIDVEGTGPLKFTDAPIGQRRGLNRIQRTAVLHFTSKSGTTGEFHLRDHSITLDTSRAGP